MCRRAGDGGAQKEKGWENICQIWGNIGEDREDESEGVQREKTSATDGRVGEGI